MDKLSYNLKEEYSHEVGEMANTLRQLKTGRIYELSGAKMDGYLSTNIEKLEKQIGELLSLIQNGDPGFATDIAKWFK